jgi:hypothetical protein
LEIRCGNGTKTKIPGNVSNKENAYDLTDTKQIIDQYRYCNIEQIYKVKIKKGIDRKRLKRIVGYSFTISQVPKEVSKTSLRTL